MHRVSPIDGTFDMETWGPCFGPPWKTSVAELIGLAGAVENAGFDRIMTGEYRSDALTWMALLAAATSYVPVTTTIYSVALRHSTVVGEAVAVIRDVSGDRIEVGFGVSHTSVVAHIVQPAVGAKRWTRRSRSVLLRCGRIFINLSSFLSDRYFIAEQDLHSTAVDGNRCFTTRETTYGYI